MDPGRDPDGAVQLLSVGDRPNNEAPEYVADQAPGIRPGEARAGQGSDRLLRPRRRAPPPPDPVLERREPFEPVEWPSAAPGVSGHRLAAAMIAQAVEDLRFGYDQCLQNACPHTKRCDPAEILETRDSAKRFLLEDLWEPGSIWLACLPSGMDRERMAAYVRRELARPIREI